MTSLIVYPIVIVISVALLILVFARSLQSAQEQKEEDQIQGHVPQVEKKKGRFATFLTRFKSKSHGAVSKLQKKAEKQKIKAALHEAQMHKEERTQEQEVPRTQVQPQQQQKQVHGQEQHHDGAQKLSRMGEIILSYHRSAADGSVGDVFHDPQEVALVQGIEENPKSVHAYESLGDYYMERQKFEDARECYKYVLRLDPRHKKTQEAMKKLDRVLGVG